MKHERKILNAMARKILAELGLVEERENETADSVKNLMDKYKVTEENFGKFYSDFKEIFTKHAKENTNSMKKQEASLNPAKIGIGVKEISPEKILTAIVNNQLMNGEKVENIIQNLEMTAKTLNNVLENVKELKSEQEKVEGSDTIKFYVVAERVKSGSEPKGLLPTLTELVSLAKSGAGNSEVLVPTKKSNEETCIEDAMKLICDFLYLNQNKNFFALPTDDEVIMPVNKK